MARPVRNPRRSVKERRQASDTRKTIAIVAILAVLLAGFGWLFWTAKQANPMLAADSLCPASGPSSVTAIVVDRTDPASPVTQAAIRSRVMSIANALPRFGRIELFAAGADERDLLTPLFSKCNPGTGADMSEVTSSPELVQRKHDASFVAPLVKALDGILDVGHADKSPILEGIQAVTVAAFPAETAQLPRTLIVVSDFVQNSSHYSMYGHAMDTGTADAAGKSVPVDLANVDVELWVIRRDRNDALQSAPAFADFWEGWFQAGGGRVVKSSPLAGRN